MVHNNNCHGTFHQVTGTFGGTLSFLNLDREDFSAPPPPPMEGAVTANISEWPFTHFCSAAEISACISGFPADSGSVVLHNRQNQRQLDDGVDRCV